jgi:hypothetical protein
MVTIATGLPSNPAAMHPGHLLGCGLAGGETAVQPCAGLQLLRPACHTASRALVDGSGPLRRRPDPSGGAVVEQGGHAAIHLQ